jgi:PKD repeat protein
VEERNNSDIFSLKGRNALGNEFFCNFQTNKHNHNYGGADQQQARSAIDIVAVDEGTTTIWVYPTNPVVGFGQPDSFSVTLEQGETINLVPGVDNGGGNITYNRDGAQHLQGTKIRVEGDKRVAVTLSDDSVHGDSGCYDLLGDQTVPVMAVDENGDENEIIGTDYIIMKGSLGWDKGGTPDYDRIYILATEDNTNVRVSDLTKGTFTDYTNMMSQEQEMYTIAYEDKPSSTLHVKADKPVYVLHVSGAEGGCELGQAVIPTISQCTGSFDVGFSRGAQSNAKTFLMNIMVLGDTTNPAIDSAKYFFEFNDAPKTHWADSFSRVPGTNWWAAQIEYTDSVAEHSNNILSNSRNIFHLGTLNGGRTNGGNFGYFSNYARVKADGIISGIEAEATKLCYGETLQLEAFGGLNYEWFPGTYLSDSTVKRPTVTPFADIQYGVRVTGASCALADTAYVNLLVSNPVEADYQMENYHGCAPLTIKPQNTSTGNQVNEWYIDDDYKTGVAQPDSFVLQNKTDSIIDYELKLIVWNLYCPKGVERLVRVFPEVNAGFEADTTIGCQPLEIAFTDTSTGHVDSATYEWDFNDLNYSNQQNPVHSFENTFSDDTTYNVKMLITSKYLCEDSAYLPITVHPLIRAKLAIDTAVSCSPLLTDLDPSNSIGVDTFFFNIQHQYDNVPYKRTTYNPLVLSHTDTSQASPDTLKIDLVTMNRFGCTDTLNQRKIIVYPEIIADFDIDTNQICDSLPITFNNLSTGYSLDYEWEFGDGANSNTASPPPHIYLNRTNADRDYVISLEATSDFLCSNIAYDTITVHPYVKSLFSLDYSDQCSPLPVTLQNSSQGQNQNDLEYDIFWGDGAYQTNQPAITDLNHTFTNPYTSQDTSYEVTLVARHTIGGCMDTSTRQVSLNPQTIANFYMQDSAGCHPLNVQFTNASQGKDLVYDWNFGQGAGTDTSIANFTKEFTNYTGTQKTYDVTLYVTNSDGCDSSITKEVNVYEYIQSDFSVQTVDSCSPFPVHIQNFSSPGATQFEWDFGDGSPVDNTENPIHTYHNTTTTLRSDTLQLVAWGNYSECADTSVQTVVTYPEMHASFALDTSAGCQPLTVGMSNASNIIAGTDFSWEFGDTTYFYGQTPPDHIFENKLSTPVTNDITLRAVSEHYCFDDTTLSVTVYPYIKARFSINKPDICSFENFIINPSASQGDIDDYRYYFDDDDSIIDSVLANSNPFEKTFINNTANTINIPIRLEAKNDFDCYSDTIRNILVRPNITADINTLIGGNFENEGCYPFQTTIINNTEPKSADGASIYEWNLGDGATTNETGSSFNHFYDNLSYTTDSVYTIRLRAQSIYDCQDTTSHTVTVHPKPKAGFSLDRTVDCPTFEPEITNHSIGATSYSWAFENGLPATSSDANPAVSFENNDINGLIAENDIQMITSTDHNCRDTILKKVRVYPRVQTSIQASPTEGCHPLMVDFTNSVSHNAYQFEWMANDNLISIKEEPENIRFVNKNPDTEVIEVMLKGTSVYGCTDSATTNVTVYGTPDVDFVPVPLSQNYDTVKDATTFTFENLTDYTEAWNYEWHFGDGNDGNQDEITFDYTYGDQVWGIPDDDFKRYVTMSASNPEFPICMDSSTHFIVIFPPAPQINIGDEVALCMYDTLPLDATYKYINNNQLDWDFGDGRTYTGDNPGFVVYEQPGQYIIKVEVTGDGGSTWDFKEITVHQSPEIDFEVYPTIGTAAALNVPPDTIYFKNLTRYGDEFLWTISGNYRHNDGPVIYDSTFNPRGAFAKEQDMDSTWYDVKLKASHFVTTDMTCYDSLLKNNVFKIVGGGKIEPPNALILNSEDPFYNTFKPYTENVAEYHLEIYDRWGTLLFDTHNPDEGWDGIIEKTGEKVKPGVYVYKIDIKFTNGRSRIRTGDITVINNR